MVDEMHEETDSALTEKPTLLPWKRVFSSSQYSEADDKRNELIKAGYQAKIRYRYAKQMYDVVHRG